jgi:hypothetical protein
VTRRSANRQKLAAAALAAREADGWIGAPIQRQHLAGAIGGSNAAIHAVGLLQHLRVRRRFPAFAPVLCETMKSTPKLGRCLATPDALHHLALMTGSGLAGGAMTRLVGRHAVSKLINGLGQDVWAYGVEKGATLDGATPRDPEDMIDLIQVEGCKAVFAYLEDAAHGLGVAAFDAAGLPYGAVFPLQDLQASKSAVQGAMERVLS